MKKLFRFLPSGALHRQRGDRSNSYFSRAAFWVAMSTSLYITSLANWFFQDQFIAFSKMKGEGPFSCKSFVGSFLMAGLLTLTLMIIFFFVYWPQIVDQFKEQGKPLCRFPALFSSQFFGFCLDQRTHLGVLIDFLEK